MESNREIIKRIRTENLKKFTVEQKISFGMLAYRFSLKDNELNSAKRHLYTVVDLIIHKINGKYC